MPNVFIGDVLGLCRITGIIYTLGLGQEAFERASGPPRAARGTPRGFFIRLNPVVGVEFYSTQGRVQLCPYICEGIVFMFRPRSRVRAVRIG